MTIFRLHESGGDNHDIVADNFTINGVWVIFTSEKKSTIELDPLAKTAFCGAYKDVFGFYAVDEDGNRIELVK
jgi:hypothetical protein